ncbi:hypothetical protein [Thiobacillus sp.]
MRIACAVLQCAERQDRRLASDGEQLVECDNTRLAAATAYQDHVDAAFAQPLE